MTADVVIIGAGPAGLSLAIGLAQLGVCVEIIDEGQTAGGQVYRAVSRNSSNKQLLDWLGLDYAKGAAVVSDAQKLDRISWRMATSVWDIRCEDEGIELGLVVDGKVSVVKSNHVVLATGAMERPTPFPGWTLPGVVSMGAAQTLLKDAVLLPEDGVVLAGQGPLLYLFASQILAAGVRPKAVLDFAPKWVAPKHLPLLARALISSGKMIAKGLHLRNQISAAGVEHLFNVKRIEAFGDDSLNRVRYLHRGVEKEVETKLLLVHDGVIANTHITTAAGCAHNWDKQQAAWIPRRNTLGQTSCKNLWMLGDGAGIAGADAAVLQGRIMARAIAMKLDLSPPYGEHQNRADLQALSRITILRRFLDRQYAPVAAFSNPPDETMICRCEAIKAVEIRTLARSGCMGPNQLRAFSRAGMGPCMGRQCGGAISRIMAAETGQDIADIGHFSIRTPLKPVTLAEVASLHKVEP